MKIKMNNNDLFHHCIKITSVSTPNTLQFTIIYKSRNRSDVTSDSCLLNCIQLLYNLSAGNFFSFLLSAKRDQLLQTGLSICQQVIQLGLLIHIHGLKYLILLQNKTVHVFRSWAYPLKMATSYKEC